MDVTKKKEWRLVFFFLHFFVSCFFVFFVFGIIKIMMRFGL